MRLPRTSAKKMLLIPFVFLGCLSVASVARAQFSGGAQTTASDPSLEMGFKPYGTFNSGNIDSINLLNSKLNIHVPLVSYPQRGGRLMLSFSIVYNWPILTWHYGNCTDPNDPRTCQVVWGVNPNSGIRIVEENIPEAPFIGTNLFSIGLPDGRTTLGIPTGSNSGVTVDGSGMVAVYSNSSGCPSGTSLKLWTVRDKLGNLYTYPCQGQSTVQDLNGNQITLNGNQLTEASSYTDTIGRVVPNPYTGEGATLPTTADFSGCTGILPTTTAYSWNLPGLNGGTTTYKVCMAMVSASLPNCSTNGTTRCDDSQSSALMIQSIVLPNGTAWTFQYDSASSPGVGGPNYGDLTSVTFPTGGTLSYIWQTPTTLPCGSGVQLMNRQVKSRTINANDGQGSHTTTYTQSVGTGTYAPIQATLTDALGNQSIHTFTSLVNTCDWYETQAQFYQNNNGTQTLLKTVATQYHADVLQTAQVAGNYKAINVMPTVVTTTWPNGQTSQVQNDYLFDVTLSGQNVANTTYGNVVAQREYDYGSGAPGGLLRQTATTFQYQNSTAYGLNNSVILPATITTTDDGGVQRQQITYNYDESPSPSCACGNQTTVSAWLNTTGGILSTRSVYNSTGTVSSSKDAKGNQTTYAYSATYSGAYPTTITNALGQATTYAYDFNTGLRTSLTDPNNQTTTYSYDNMWRIFHVNYPDSGQVTITHQETSFPFTATATTKINSTQNKVQVSVFDGLGRVTQTQVTSDADGAVYVDTSYDGLGRVFTQSNPHRSSALQTDGTTTHIYDSLGRLCVLIPPDGSSVSGNTCPASQPTNDVFTVYSGNSTTVTDQAGNARRSFADALGRLIEKDEPGASSPATPATGSASVAGTEQSIGGTPATPGTGSVTFNGTLQSKQVQTQAASSGSGTVTIGGTQQPPVKVCDPRCSCSSCYHILYDSGSVTVTVNGFSKSAPYSGGAANSGAIASSLYTAFNGDSNSPVTAQVNGSVLTLTAKATGSATNYSVSTSVTYNMQYFSSAPFTATPSGGTLTGGANATYTTIYDSGSCTITTNGHPDSTPPWSGSGTTPSSIVSSLVSVINGDSGALVNASPSGNTVNLTARTPGATTNYPVSSSCTYDSTNFSGPSFTTTNSGGSLTGGTNTGATTYDSGSVWIKVAGFQAPPVPYGQNDTQTSLATNLAAALNAPGSPVIASANGASVNIQAKAAGANTNYTLSGGSSTSQPSSFSQPSFTISASGSTLTGGSSPTLSLSIPAITTYNYDILDNLISVVQSGSRQRSFSYDSLSRLMCASNPENSSAACPATAGSYTTGTIGYTYDANGNLITKTALAANKPGTATVTTTYSYDALNRMTQKSYSDGTPTVTFGYDAVAPSGCTPPSLTIDNGIGKRTGMCDAAGAEAWSYDIVSGTGWKTTDARSTSGVTLTTVAQSNLDGSTNSITYPSGHVVSYGPGGAGQPLSATDTSASISYAANAHYWPSGALAALTGGGTISFTAILNSRLQPCWIYATTGTALPWNSTTACTATAATGSILDLKYNFNLGSADNGNVMGIANNRDSTRSQAFSYDPLNRLTTAQTASTYSTSTSNCFGESFAYDAWGNLLSVSESSSSYDGCAYEQPQGWTMTAKNQIQASATCFDGSGNLLTVATYCYDAAGNLLTNTAISFAYDAENHIKSIPMLGISYLYDGDGRRVAKLNSSNQATKLYWYGTGSDPLDETDGTGATNNSAFFEYAFFNGNRIARRDASNNVSYYFADHLGTPRAITNASGVICYDADFYPFGGERTVIDTCDSGYKHTGKERDSESNLDNFGARYFGSSLGRFMSPDPGNIGGELDESANPQSWNLYAYVRNNPLNLVDPDGLDCVYSGDFKNSGTVLIERGDRCSYANGTYVNGTVDEKSLVYDQKSNQLSFDFSNPEDQTGGTGVISLGPPRSEGISDSDRFDAVRMGVGLGEQGVNWAMEVTASNAVGAVVGGVVGEAIGSALSRAASKAALKAAQQELKSLSPGQYKLLQAWLGKIKAGSPLTPPPPGLTREAMEAYLKVAKAYVEVGSTPGGMATQITRIRTLETALGHQ